MKTIKTLLVSILFLLTVQMIQAQTYVGSPMTGTPAAGKYYNDVQIKVNPNFTFTATSGNSLQLYIVASDSASLGNYLNLSLVQQENIRIPGVTSTTNDSLLYSLTPAQKQTTRSYTDGAGRVVQTLGVHASPLENDLIQPVAYDNLGRQTIGFLPYAGKVTDTPGLYRPNAISVDQPNFYLNTSQYLVATDANPYTQQVFENSPLQRMLEAGMVGSNFQPVQGQHYKTVSYRYNNSGDGNIPIWNPDGTFTTGNYFAANTLAVTDGIDEDHTETLSFTDRAGHIILKRQILATGNLDTYYIYNWAGMISYIVPPKAIAIMAGTYSLTATGVSKLIFHFVYNTLGQLIEKTVPAKGVMTIVYDPLHRPVLMQDSNMRVANKWNYIKYDVKGRAISQGIYTDNVSTTRKAMQSHVDSLASSYNTAWYETRNHLSSSRGYYTSSIFPNTNITPLAYSYYDDYDLEVTGSANYSYGTQHLPNEETPTTAYVKGVPTMNWQTTVGSGLSGMWLLKVTFYDKRGNPIQTLSNNHVKYVASATVTDTATSVPDFAGVPQITKVSKKTGASTTTTVQTNLTYDQMYRVKAVDQYYNGSATVTHVAAYAYNEVGQLIKKSLSYNTTTSTWNQNVDMRYNIRGQLLTINNSKLANDGGVTSGDSNDLFGIQMLYDQVDANLANTAYYNGKLSAVKWMSKDASGTSSYERAFRYYYDALNRDTAAIYAERTAASTSAFATTNGWNENRITYDQNGNLLTLFRDSTSQGSGGHTPIDNLTYTYDTNNPNQLQKVTDGTGAQYTNSGFRNRTGSTSRYTYDGNGNLTNEPYKGFSSIAYNVLNRTDKITFTVSANRYIDYTYDASGNLIRKRQYDNSGGSPSLLNTTDYIDGFVYTTVSSTQTLQYFAMPEGRVLNSAGTLSLEYSITDQQGNVRIAFDNSGTGGTAKVRQENSYYAFGLIMPGSTVTTPTNPNKHLYNGGSEWQNDYSNLPDYYQTYYRNYDAALGRWVGVDPDAEGAESLSSYQYAGNNPIMYNDPLGDLYKLPLPQYPPGYGSGVGGFTDDLIDNGMSGGAAPGSRGFGGIPDADRSDFSEYWTSLEAQNGFNVSTNGTSTTKNSNAGIKIGDDAGYRIGLALGADRSASNTTIVNPGTIDYNHVTTTIASNSDNLQGISASDADEVGVINIFRTWETNKSTISYFYTSNGSVSGYIIEPRGPSTAERNQNRRIPAGTYDLQQHINKSLHAEWELYNNDVPGDNSGVLTRAILFHIGNYFSNTEGCLIPGFTRGVNFVGSSGPAIDALNNYINSYNGNVIVNISDPVRQYVPFFEP